MFETAVIQNESGRGLFSFSGSLLLQSGIAGGLLCLGLWMPIAQPELPDLRIAPPAPRFKDAIKVIASSVTQRAAAPLSRRVLEYIPQTRPAAAAATAITMDQLFEAGPVVGSSPLIPGGVVGSVLGPSIAVPAPQKPVAPETPKAAPAAPLAIGGNVLASKLLHRVTPIYPAIAKNARIEGVVQLHGVITKDGRIAELRVLSGHPLLVNAALEAVRQWVYSPTLLNGQAVEVQAPIEVRFLLSR
ncbi:energy transducer TonB [Bryobacter aggregatus]|uniref:energy transducer TonB n=1 Tax=Bryobacter aggregatus TaxID=360054 RepID=UPI00068F10D5|nr:energy transducer TonB [Bryobacter aggregatus]